MPYYFISSTINPYLTIEEDEMRALFLILMVSLAGSSLAAEDPDIFIYPFEFEGFSSAERKTFNKSLGKVLASELQDKLFKIGGTTPSTLTNMQSQLKKEKEKEILQCDDTKCLQKIVENFGISDTVFGKVTKIGGKLQVYISLVRDDKVVNSKTGRCKKNIDALIDKVKEMTGVMFKLESGTVSKITTIGGGDPGTAYQPKRKTLVDINSTPEGASLLLNGVEKGTTPFSGFITSGTYTLKLALAYYKTHTEQIKVKGLNPGEIARFSYVLEENFGTLKLTGVPIDAEVLIDGKSIGTGVLTSGKLNIGSHLLTVRGEKYFTFSNEFTVFAGKVSQLNMVLKKKTGYLQLMVTDNKNKILKGKLYIDDEYLGPVPFDGVVVVGDHKLVIKTSQGELSKEVKIGFQKTKIVEMKLDTSTDMQKNLKKNLGSENKKEARKLLKLLSKQKKSTNGTKAIPPRLTNATKIKTMSKHKSKVAGCFKKFGAVAGLSFLNVRLTVKSSGSIEKVEIKTPGVQKKAPRQYDCINAILKNITFPRFKKAKDFVFYNYPVQ